MTARSTRAGRPHGRPTPDAYAGSPHGFTWPYAIVVTLGGIAVFVLAFILGWTKNGDEDDEGEEAEAEESAGGSHASGLPDKPTG